MGHWLLVGFAVFGAWCLASVAVAAIIAIIAKTLGGIFSDRSDLRLVEDRHAAYEYEPDVLCRSDWAE